MTEQQEPAPRGPYRQGRLTRQRVLDVAVEAFGRLGYRGATLQVVAEGAGMTSGGVVKLFGSKERLLRAVVDRWDLTTGAALFSSGAHGWAFLAALPAFVGAHADHRPMIELQARLLVEAIDPAHPAHRQVAARYECVRRVFADEVLRAALDGDINPRDDARARAEASAIIALMDGLQQHWLLDQDVDMAAGLALHLAGLRAAP